MNLMTLIMTIIQMFNLSGAKSMPKEVNIYPIVAVVSEVDRARDIVTFETNNGFLFEWEGVEDLKVNDTCALMMCDMGTQEIKDDVILSIRYSGFEVERDQPAPFIDVALRRRASQFDLTTNFYLILLLTKKKVYVIMKMY